MPRHSPVEMERFAAFYAGQRADNRHDFGAFFRGRRGIRRKSAIVIVVSSLKK